MGVIRADPKIVTRYSPFRGGWMRDSSLTTPHRLKSARSTTWNVSSFSLGVGFGAVGEISRPSGMSSYIAIPRSVQARPRATAHERRGRYADVAAVLLTGGTADERSRGMLPLVKTTLNNG